MDIQKENIQYAGFWVRTAAGAVDSFIINLVTVIVIIIVSYLIHSSISTGMYLKFILLFLMGFSILNVVVYLAWFNANGRQTPGKTLFGIAARSTSLESLALLQSFFRAIFQMFGNALLGLGYLLIIFNKRKRALQDFMARTVVIRVAPARKNENKLIDIVLISIIILSPFPPLFLRAYYIQAFKIPSISMVPTLINGDHIMVDKHSPIYYPPKPGDLIVFNRLPDDDKQFLKRCIAIGGQTVEIRDNFAYVNVGNIDQYTREDQKLIAEISETNKNFDMIAFNNNQSFIFKYPEKALRKYGPETVPLNQYFALGDNLNNSADSRIYGPVPVQNLVGKGAFIYFSWDSANNRIRFERIGKIVE
jgi:signal peptidase I